MARLPDDPDFHTMSFGDHLEELRKRIFLAIVVPLPLMILLFMISDWLIAMLRIPLTDAMIRNDLDPTLQALGPPEVLLTKMKLSIIAALIVAAPWILWQVWLFVAPGLYRKERRFVHFLIPLSGVLTLAGAALMYFAMLPLILYVLIGFGAKLADQVEPDIKDADVAAWLDANHDVPIRAALPAEPEVNDGCLVWPNMTLHIARPNDDGVIEWTKVPKPRSAAVLQEFRLGDYISFVLMLFLGIVMAFQLPLALLLLTWIGLADRAFFARHRKQALLVCAAISALITPADVISMMAMLLPLYLLYEFGLLLTLIAPASKVSEGSVLTRPDTAKATTDKPTITSSETTETAQSDVPPQRRQPLDQYQVDQSDDDEATT
ncbi:MAG: twin-arginine translocase subunit TatC [Planctomycetota bacterium]